MIRTEALSFSYEYGTQAIREVSLEVRDGEFLALLGANGCGKTTLLKQLNGLLKPSAGRVFLDGKELGSFRDEEVFKRVGMVFQDPNDQLFATNVEQDVAFGPVNLGLKPDEVARRTAEALRLVGSPDLADKAIHTLSFGQKRRVSIAGVLAMEPGMLLLDEPTSGLDPRGVSSIMRLLRRLNKARGITMLMATHDVDLVPLFCDRVGIMSQGRIIADGTPEKVFADTSLVREAKLRLPRLGHLVEVLNKEDGMHFETMPMTIGEARREFLKLAQVQSRADRLTGVNRD